MTEKHAVLKEHGKNYDLFRKNVYVLFLIVTVFYRLNVVVLFIHHLELSKHPVLYKSQCFHDVCLFSFKILFRDIDNFFFSLELIFVFKFGLMWFSHDSD